MEGGKRLDWFTKRSTTRAWKAMAWRIVASKGPPHGVKSTRIEPWFRDGMSRLLSIFSSQKRTAAALPPSAATESTSDAFVQ